MWKSSIVLILIVFAVYGSARPPKKRFCVIGAGVAGLISAKHLSLYPKEFEPIVFEKQSDVGGLWIYTNSTTVDEHGLSVHSSLYKYLRTNNPIELQALPDYTEFKWDDSLSSFVDHPQVLQYLRNYTERFNLRQYIQFNTNVEKVSSLPGMRWLLVIRDLNINKKNEIICDAAIIASGNNVKGHIPELPGIENFSGRVIHSHTYRYPEEFANQTVVALGASSSGTDISIDVSQFAEKVYLSYRGKRKNIELPSNVEQVLGVVGADGNELILSNGTKLKADALILCTGYDYDFPFLDESTGIVIDGPKYVKSLYKHLINVKYPTMAILNLPIPSLPFHLPHSQVAYFVAVLRGKITLPSHEDMLKDAELRPGIPKSKGHYVHGGMFGYYNELAVAAKFDTAKESYMAAISILLTHFRQDPLNFRKKRFHFMDVGKVEFY